MKTRLLGNLGMSTGRQLVSFCGTVCALLVILCSWLLFTPSPAGAATLVVTSRADSGAGSLRQAFLSVIPGDVITFDATVFPPANPATIRLLSALPDISTGNLTINASNAGVVLDGTYTPSGTRGFRITSNGNVIKGLKIINFPGNGVQITNGAKNNTIGGDWTIGSAPRGEGNIITLNANMGVEIEGSGTDNNTVSGNLIGLDADGTRDIRVQAMAISPNYAIDQTLFIGTAFHGVWKTTDGGTTWTEMNGGLTIADVRALAISPTFANDRILFAGANGGIFKTTNGGTTWTRVDGGVTSNTILSIGISPVYSSDGHVFAGTAVSGVFISTDGGSTWTARGSGITNVSVNSLGISPNYSTDRTVFAGTSNGFFKSINQGYVWTEKKSGLTSMGVTTIAFSPGYSGDQTLFVSTTDCNNALLKSINRGDDWTVVGANNGSGQCLDAIAISPNYATDRTIFAGNDWPGIFRSTDAGGSWANVSRKYFVKTLAVSPNYTQDHLLFAGPSFDGILKSSDGGNTWIEVNGGLTESGNYSGGVLVSNGAQGNTIGGTTAGKRNVISNNFNTGIALDSSDNIVSGNFIGTDASGTLTLGNSAYGIVIGYERNVVGGVSEGARNIISGHGFSGIRTGDNSSDNTVMGNYIGTDVNGRVALGNTFSGISIAPGSQRNVIGGANIGERNIISGNGFGIAIWSFGTAATSDNRVIGNFIGTDRDGTNPLANIRDGVLIWGGPQRTFIGGAVPGQANVIAYNSGGITILDSKSIGNTISRNSIHSNTNMGIDNWGGGNLELSPPALVANTATTVTGISPLPNVTIEIFSDDADEGRIYEGTVTADANGDFTFTKAGGFQGPYLTATATDGDGNTSEFSSPRRAVGAGTVSYTVTVTKSGSGGGVVSSQPSPISCGAVCSGSFTSSTTVTLTATADSGSVFGGWSGACSGTQSTCTVRMDGAKTVTASFNPTTTTQYLLSVTKAGTASGQVTSTPYGINCGSTCSANFSSGQSVMLSAAADTGATFAGWSGACSGTGTCTLTMLANRSVTATFTAVATDTTPPTGASVVINGGAASTGTKQATLTLSATDPSGMGQMKFSNDNATWSNPVSFASKYDWTLTAGDGVKTVYAKFSDSLGNWLSAPVSDTITLSTTIAPANPSGLAVADTGATSVTLKWDKNNDDSVYHVFRSETGKGVFYRINTAAISEESFTWDALLRAFKVNFTDTGLKEGRTYYYAVQAVAGGVTSVGLSSAVSTKTLTIDDYVVNVIDPTNIVNIGNAAKYYIQLLPGNQFKGTVSLSCSGMPTGLTYDFIVNGERKGASATGLIPPVSVVLEVLAGSSTQTIEHRFDLVAQNFWTGGSSDLRESSLTLTVLSRYGAGIHAEVEKATFRKGEKVKVYGSIQPMEENRTVTLTLTPNGGSPSTKNIPTTPGGKFEDSDWISTLGIGRYTISASWMDSQANQYVSATRSFTVEKGQPVLTCLRKTGETGVIGGEYTIMGSIKPVIPYGPLTLQVEDPDGVASRQSLVLDSEGQYARIDSFFTKNGIWKFRTYFAGNDDYIGAESNELVVSVGVEYGRAIILGGGVAEQSNTYWEATKKLTVAAYRDFKSKGFRNDMIHYLINSSTIDINYDDIPDNVVSVSMPTVAALLDAVKNQFTSALGPNTPLFIYLQGHGTTDGRLKVLGADQYLTAADFKDALDYLQGVGRYAGRQGSVDVNVVILIEACYSGSFIATLSGSKRVILTSAGTEAYNTDASGQISFSRRLFSKLLEGDNVKKAFDYARTTQVNMNYPAPRLDDNGDGLDNTSDGLLATNLYLNGQLTWGMKPTLGTVTLSSLLEGRTATPVSAEVLKGDVNIEKVWLQVMAPNAAITGEGTISYPEVELTKNAATGIYEGTLTDLRIAGIYKLVILARDVNKEVSDPGLAYITVTGTVPGDVNGDGSVTIADAVQTLQITSGMSTTGQTVNTSADVNGDNKIGLPEAIYILQKAAGVR